MALLFCAPVVMYDLHLDNVPVPEHVVSDLSGLASSDPDDKLAQYLIDEEPSSPLHGLPITDGTLSMSLRSNQLHICASYTVAGTLTPQQTGALRMYTEIQFSDGAGEGWNQQLWHRNKVRLEIVWRDTALVSP